uniref:Uncharacterized protein n=1 Tax=Heterorhabditis bacteriophora TaxID=37862 RepID=A0A1I7WW57_HETBA
MIQHYVLIGTLLYVNFNFKF